MSVGTPYSWANSFVNSYSSVLNNSANLPIYEINPSSPDGDGMTPHGADGAPVEEVAKGESVDNPNNINDIYNFAKLLRDLEDKAIKDQQNFNLASAKSAMDFSASEAQKNRDFQEYMSNTAYQRAMTDLRKASLNPVLAYAQGSASTPAGSTGTGYSTSSAKAEYNKENITKDLYSLLTNTAVEYARINSQALTGMLNAVGSVIPG